MNLPDAKPHSGLSALFRNLFKRNFGIAMLYTVLCFVSYPMMLFLILSVSRSNVGIQICSGFGYVFMGGLSVLFSMILSTRLFGFMHSRPASDVYHSLPIKRSTSFWLNYLIGLMFVLVPFILNMLLSLFMCGDSIMYIEQFLRSLLSSVISIAEFYTFCVFFHVTCGTSFGANLYNLLLNFGYVISMFVISITLNGFLPGFASTVPQDVFVLFSPISGIFSGWYTALSAGYDEFSYIGFNMWIHAGVLAIFLLLSFLLYRIRKSEAAGKSFAFSLPKHILRFIITTGGSLFLALIFYFISSTGDSVNLFPMFVGAFVGGALAHFIMEIIFSKGFGTMLKSLPAFGVYCVLFTVTYILLSNGWFGFDTWTPRAEDVQSVKVNAYISENFEYYGEGAATIDEFYGDDYGDDYVETYEPTEEEIFIKENGYPKADEAKAEEIKKLISDAGLANSVYDVNSFMLNNITDSGKNMFSRPETIEQVLALHHNAIQDAVALRPYSPGCYKTNPWNGLHRKWIELTLTYSLKNGRTVVRRYCLGMDEAVEKNMDALCSSRENQYNQLYLYNPSSPPSYTVLIETKSDNLLLDKQKCDELIKCLKTELEAASSQTTPGGDAIDLDIFIRVRADDAYPDYKLVRLTLDSAQFPNSYALLQGCMTAKKAG